MNRGLYAAVATATLLSASVCTACATRPGTPAVSSDNALQGPVRSVDGSQVADYGSLSEVKAASAAEIIGTVSRTRIGGSADQEGTSPLRAFLTIVTVESSIEGSIRAGASITLRQIAAPGASQPFDFTLAHGRTYVLYLQPFTFGGGYAPTDEYVVTGEQGSYLLADSKSRRSDAEADLADGIQSRLPAKVTLAELTR
jgi:hypothetical protein